MVERRGREGFTLTEMVMVIALLGILATVAVPNFYDLRNDAKDAVTRDRLQALKRAIMGDGRTVAGGTYTFPGFKADAGRYPSALSELITQPAAIATYDPINRSGWRGPYIDNSTISAYSTDGWGTAFEYSTSPTPFIRSWGPNRAYNTGAGDDITLTY